MPWLLFLPLIAAALAILGGTLRGLLILWRFLKAVVKISEALPTLLEIAEQFKPNGGNSLHDRLTSLNSGLAEANHRLDDLGDGQAAIWDQGQAGATQARDIQHEQEHTHTSHR